MTSERRGRPDSSGPHRSSYSHVAFSLTREPVENHAECDPARGLFLKADRWAGQAAEGRGRSRDTIRKRVVSRVRGDGGSAVLAVKAKENGRCRGTLKTELAV